MNNNILYLICLVFLTVIVYSVFYKKENYANYYLGQPTKCFDCERQMPVNKKYLAGPTKCFDCEKDIKGKFGPQYANLGHNTKCFDCELQMGKNVTKNITKN